MSRHRDGFAPLDSRFEIVEHTADFALHGQAPDLAGIFQVMARGLFGLIADLETIRPLQGRKIDLAADNQADLLHDWLQELNGLHHVHGEVYSDFQVRIHGNRIEATVRGEANDPARHDIQHEVKGVTWHDFQLEEVPGGYTAQVLLDV